MSNEIVQYHNDLNSAIMSNWTAEEMDFFFAILTQVKNKGTDTVIIEKKDLVNLANYSIKNRKRFFDTMNSLDKKIKSLRFIKTKKANGKNSVKSISLFPEMEYEYTDDLSEFSAVINLSPKFEYILNNFFDKNREGGFTKYELAEFVSLKSVYAKNGYRFIKQWRTVGKKQISIDEFKKIFDTPDYYTPSHIDRLVLKPVKKELPQYFSNLRIKKLQSKKRGRPVIGYSFTWKPEVTNGEYKENLYDKSNNKKSKKSNIPDWSNPNYQDKVTPEEQKKLDEFKKKSLERLANINKPEI